MEYQTIRRLPRTQHVVYTIHTYLDPLPAMRAAPRAAEALVVAIRNLTPIQLKYRDMVDEGFRGRICSYLEQLY